MRSLIGPAIVAVAVWAATGSVTLQAENPGVRLVAPASPLWLAAGLIVGFVLPAWRRSPLLAAPALLSVLPWLPLPLPAVLLLWTGPLAWILVGVAVVVALMARQGQWPAAARIGSVPGNTIAAGLASLLAGSLVLASVGGRLPGGDEPHYLVIAQSLLKDGDLRIANNHANRDYAEYWGGHLAPHVVQPGQDGEIYSIHAPGVAVLVAPLFALFGLLGAQLTVLGVAGLAGALVWLAGWYAAGQTSGAWFAWAAVMGSVTMLVQSVTIFPDGPGAAIVAAALVVWLRLGRGGLVATPMLVAVSGLLAVLPFLHTRFVILSAGFGLAFLHRVWMTADAADRFRRVAAFLAAPTLGALCWFGYFFVIYGTPNPAIAYGTNSESRVAYIPGGVAGLLFDQQFGLFSYSPVLVLAMVGWMRRREGGGPGLWPLALIAGGYLATVATYWMWWAGVPATPARLATSVLPLLAAPLAVAWRDSGAAQRTLAVLLLAASLGISLMVLGVDGGRLAWSARDAQAPWLWALGPVVDLPRGWPSFFWRLVGGDVSSEWPFAVHVLAWCSTFLAVMLSARAIARAGAPTHDGLVALAGWVLPVGLMAATQVGWWLNDSPGVRSAPSQVAVLRSIAEGAPIFEVSPGSITRVPRETAPVRITVPRIDLPGGPMMWAGLRDVPAGEFDLRLTARRPIGGVLTVRAGFSRDPLQVATLPRQSAHTVRLSLPVGTTDLAFIPDEALAAGDGSLLLVPRAVAPGAHAPAVARLQVGDTDVYVVGGAPYVEVRALWVRGGGAAQLRLAARHTSPRPLTMTLSNGPHRNLVDVTIADETRRIELAPSASAVVPVSVTGAGPVTVTVTSPSGFRPSDDGQSADRRYLGVRVAFGDAPENAPPAVDQ
jgi:hypothetical protein